MKNTLIFISVFIFTQIHPVFGADADNLNHRIDSISQRLERIEKSWDNLQKGFENKKEELKSSNEKEFIRFEKEYRNNYWYSLFGSFSLGAIVAIISLYLSIGKIIKHNLIELFQCELHDNRHILIDMITRKEKDIKLKTKKKILIVSPEGSDLSFFKKALSTWGFTNVDYKYLSEKYQFDSADVVIFNNWDHKFKLIEDVNKIIETSPETTLKFYFGPRIGESSELANFANSKSQLHGNLMNTLQYHEVLMKNI